MDKLAFSSLLIGLLAGLQPISVEVSPEVHAATLEIVLDGSVLAHLTKPPWTTSVDLGSELKPHVIAALALDTRGHEVGRVARELNVPHGPAQVDILVQRDRLDRPIAAKLVATSVLRDSPLERTLTFDGAALLLDGNAQAALPPFDASQTHILTGVARFPNDVEARADLALGGVVTESSGARLTAIALRVPDSGAKTNTSSVSFMASGIATKPALIEKGSATVLIVRDPRSTEASRKLNRIPDFQSRLDPGDRAGFIWPVSKNPADGVERADLLDSSPLFAANQGGFLWLLTRVSRPGRAPTPPFHFADAVAVAGLQAAGYGTRRAVVFVEGDEQSDDSHFSPAQVIPYLRSLGVPLHVWSLRGSAPSAWSASPEDIHSIVGLQKAFRTLREDLEHQRIAWLTGKWLPGQVAISGRSGMELLR